MCNVIKLVKILVQFQIHFLTYCEKFIQIYFLEVQINYWLFVISDCEAPSFEHIYEKNSWGKYLRVKLELRKL